MKGEVQYISRVLAAGGGLALVVLAREMSRLLTRDARSDNEKHV